MGQHSLLSASSSKRWISCPPAARLGEGFEEKASDYAQEGTDAHSLCEYKLKATLGMPTKDPTENLTFYNEDMVQCANDYATYIFELVEKAKQTCKDPVVLIEQRLDFSHFVPDGFGTGDCVIVADGTLYVIDYKHGQGVLVEAEDNPQMKLYALGALELFDGIYDIETLSMTIFQPRRENVSTYIVSKEELYQWAEKVLVPAAQLAFKGEGEFKVGEYCRFCKAKAVCRKRAEYNLEIARYDFEMPATLEDEEIASILYKLDDLVNWAADVKEYALQSALRGKEFSGWKVVQGRSNRIYSNEDLVIATVAASGFDPCEHKVLGITAMQKMLGKAKFEELLGGFIERPQGKPTIVPVTDKRLAINTAENDFIEN